MWLTNLYDVILYQQQYFNVASTAHVEWCPVAFLVAPDPVNKRIANDYIVLIVTWIDVDRRVTVTEVEASAQIYCKPTKKQPIFTIVGCL